MGGATGANRQTLICLFGQKGNRVNLETPSDNHIRDMLDPATPGHFIPVFADVVGELEMNVNFCDIVR